MGGYGALLCGIHHPELFSAVAALSPVIACLDLLDVRLVIPMNRLLMGRARAEQRGRIDIEDILDTCDLVFSRNRPLMPTVRRDRDGRAAGMDDQARRNWEESDLCLRARSHPAAFRDARVLVNCEESDEFMIADPCRRLHAVLEELGVRHEFEVYRDRRAARLSAHALGIAWHVLPALRFCLAGSLD
jgi:S-formylglutathione hydrolase FrmB